MRDIKFKAWDKYERKMIEQNEVMWGMDFALSDLSDFLCNNDYYNFMQYTGFKDKNGVEIFELDHFDNYEVRWNQKSCNYILFNIVNSDIMDCNEQNTSQRTITGNRFISENT